MLYVAICLPPNINFSKNSYNIDNQRITKHVNGASELKTG